MFVYECAIFSWFNFSEIFQVPQITKVKKSQATEIGYTSTFHGWHSLLHFLSYGIPYVAKNCAQGNSYKFRVVGFIVLTFYYLHLHLNCMFYYLSMHMCYVSTYLLCYQVSTVDKSHVMFYCCLNCLSNSFCHLLVQPLPCHFYYVCFCCL